MSQLTPKQLDVVKEQFKEHDQNGDGSITLEEFTAVLGDYYSDEYIADLVKKSDIDSDGKISYEEFLSSHGG